MIMGPFGFEGSSSFMTMRIPLLLMKLWRLGIVIFLKDSRPKIAVGCYSPFILLTRTDMRFVMEWNFFNEISDIHYLTKFLSQIYFLSSHLFTITIKRRAKSIRFPPFKNSRLGVSNYNWLNLSLNVKIFFRGTQSVHVTQPKKSLCSHIFFYI